MGVVTSQKISLYYDQYRDKEITFTKDILRILGVDPRQIYFKCNGVQWSCIINSASFIHARIILGTKGGAYALLNKKDVPPINLHFHFFEQGNQAVSFFVAGHVEEIVPYMNSSDLAIVTIKYNQRPPDDLIEKIGVLLEANANAVRRKEDRILINEDSKRKLLLSKEETIVYVQSVPRHCIIRDISFSGTKIIMVGVPKFLLNKQSDIIIAFEDMPAPLKLTGTIVHVAQIEGRKDIVYANICFNENLIPLTYKLHINVYFSALGKKQLSVAEQFAQQRKNQEQLAKQKEFNSKAEAAKQETVLNNANAIKSDTNEANKMEAAEKQAVTPSTDASNIAQTSVATPLESSAPVEQLENFN